jgi:hypothetical protein
VRGECVQPLLDPTKVAWRLLIILALIGGVPLFVELTTAESIDVFAVFQAVSFACPLAAYSLLLRPSTGRTVFYLRAFRSDLDSTNLRSALRAVLGRAHQLRGIRPPRERGFLPVRVLVTLRDGFRSLGSPFFELEADDDNWMVRLLASYRRARFVFIDIRDLTTFVEEEIRLSYLAFGLSRCMFIANQNQTHEESCSRVTAIIGDPAMDQNRLMMLYYSDDESTLRDLTSSAATFLQTIPAEGTTISPEAIDFAAHRVPIKKWRARFRDTERGRLTYAVIGPSLIGFLVAFLTGLVVGADDDVTWRKILAIFAYGVSFATFVAYFGALKRARKQAEFEQIHAFGFRSSLSGSRLRLAYLFGCCGALLTVPVLNLFILAAADTIWEKAKGITGVDYLWAEKALSGSFRGDRGETWEFNSNGTCREMVGRTKGTYVVNGQKVEMKLIYYIGDSKFNGYKVLSLQDIIRQGVRLERRP